MRIFLIVVASRAMRVLLAVAGQLPILFSTDREAGRSLSKHEICCVPVTVISNPAFRLKPGRVGGLSHRADV